MTRKNVAVYIWPGMTMLDSLGPHQILGMMPEFNVYSFAKTAEPFEGDTGQGLIPKYGFADCPRPDILVVGGGANPLPQMQDREVVEFIAKAGADAEYVGSVCTGALILAEAGLLDGYRATTHWGCKDVLAAYPGIEVVAGRVVADRNRVTGGGVTAGIDWAIALIERVLGRPAAQMAELIVEYTPQPPCGTGSPESAPPEILAAAQGMMAQLAPGLPEFVMNR